MNDDHADDIYAPDDDVNMNEVLVHRMLVVVLRTLDFDWDKALLVGSWVDKALVVVVTYQVHRSNSL